MGQAVSGAAEPSGPPGDPARVLDPPRHVRLLIIGSAAGVAAMGIMHIDFIWYLRKMTVPAAIGYVGGMITFYLMFG